MDELKEAWKELILPVGNPEDSSYNELVKTIGDKSRGPLEKLKGKVLAKLVICIVLIVFMAVYIPFANPFISQVLLFIVLIAYVIGSVLLYQEYESIRTNVDMSQNLLGTLKSYHKKFIDIAKYEELVSLLIYPISIPAGFFVGIKARNPDAPILEDTLQWVFLIITIVTVVPLSHTVTRWLNKKAFSKYLKEIDANIKMLEEN